MLIQRLSVVRGVRCAGAAAGQVEEVTAEFFESSGHANGGATKDAVKETLKIPRKEKPAANTEESGKGAGDRDDRDERRGGDRTSERDSRKERSRSRDRGRDRSRDDRRARSRSRSRDRRRSRSRDRRRSRSRSRDRRRSRSRSRDRRRSRSRSRDRRRSRSPRRDREAASTVHSAKGIATPASEAPKQHPGLDPNWRPAGQIALEAAKALQAATPGGDTGGAGGGGIVNAALIQQIQMQV